MNISCRIVHFFNRHDWRVRGWDIDLDVAVTCLPLTLAASRVVAVGEEVHIERQAGGWRSQLRSVDRRTGTIIEAGVGDRQEALDLPLAAAPPPISSSVLRAALLTTMS